MRIAALDCSLECSTLRPKSLQPSRSRATGLLVLALLGWLIGLASPVEGQGTLTTSDGLTLSLSSTGVVNTLKSGSTNYASAMPSGFFYRELAATTSNVILNGSFESGLGTPTSWSIAGGTGGTWSIDTTTFSAGLRSMKISIPGTTPKHSPDLISSNVAILPNTPYTFSYNVRTSGLSYALTIFLYEVDSAGKSIRRALSSQTGTAGWLTAPLSLTFVSGANASHVYCDTFVYNGYGTAWLDDVQLVDVFGGNQPINFTGAVTSSGGVLTQTASKNGLNLSATFTNVGSAIKVDATLTDTTGLDRALELSYQLPLNVPGWTWDQDFITPLTIAANARYQYLDSGFGAGQSHSVYPFGTVRNAATAFSLAVPLGPQMDRLSYDTGDGLRVSWDLGLSAAATKTPSKASVSFWVYTANPTWGLRAAAEKYYALNPAAFTSATSTTGAWELENSIPLSTVPNPQDFGFAFEEGDSELAFDNANGILGLHYVDPSGWFRPFPGYTTQPSYATLIATLLADAASGTGTTNDSTPVTEMAQAVINSSPYNQAGLYEVLDNPYFWYNGYAQIYPVSPDPNIPAPSIYSVIKKYRVDNRITIAQNSGNVLGGIFLDDLTWVFSSLENYRRPLWAYSDLPLSFSYDSRKVTLFNGFSMAEFVDGLADYVHSRGLIMSGSMGPPGTNAWFANKVDMMGGEVTDAAESFDKAYTRRALSYGKRWSNLFVSHTSAPSAALVLTYLRQALLLGYFPGFNGIYWDDSSAYERDRPLFKQYIPLIQKEAAAGWQPVTYATPSDPSTLVERFGNPSAGTFYISAQNTGAVTSAPQFTIDGAGLGIATTSTVTVKELLSNTSLTVTRAGTNISFSDTFNASETSFYQLSISGSLPPPAVGAISPSTGTTAGGTQVTISGTNFQTGLSVTVGGVPAVLTNVTATSILATTGAHSAGSADVVVTNPDAQIATLANGFTYQDGPAPDANGTSFYTLIPCRVLDTRSPNGPLGGPALSANVDRLFTLIGQCGIPAGARTLSLNVTVTSATNPGTLQLFAGGSPAPGTTAISYRAGQTRANNAMVTLGGSGDLVIQADQVAGTVNVILDVNGYFQ
jgi:IPT/TIG domain-containing protein